MIMDSVESVSDVQPGQQDDAVARVALDGPETFLDPEVPARSLPSPAPQLPHYVPAGDETGQLGDDDDIDWSVRLQLLRQE